MVRLRRFTSAAAPRAAPLAALVTVLSVAFGIAALAQEYGGSDAAPAGDAVPASAGVYTEEQADLGRAAYERSCMGCHGPELAGAFGPPLAPLDPWAYRGAGVDRLFSFMRSAMPFDAPGSLDDETYAAILAYVLSRNGYPAGPEPLPAVAEALAGFVLDEPPVADDD